MAMTAAGLKAEIQTQLTTQFGAAEDATKREKLATAMATAIVNYLKANAQVVAGIAVQVNTGTGTGATTGTGTIT